MQVREIGDHRLVFVSNQEGERHKIKLHLDAKLSGSLDRQTLQIRRLNLETGEAERIAYEVHAGGWTVPLSFAPYESHVIELGRFADEGGQGAPAALVEPWDLVLDASGDWELKAERHNAIRFDRFRLSFYDADNQRVEAGTADAKTFIDQCDDLAANAGIQLPLHFAQQFGTPKKLLLRYPVRCTYETEFIAEELPKHCELLMDQGAISGEYVIKINGTSLDRSDFRRTFVYDHRNIACPIGPHLQSGVNRLTVEVTVHHDWDGVVDALYVQGDFAVQFNEQSVPVMTRPAGQASLAPLAAGPCSGYPYYAGILTYRKTFELPSIPDGGAFRLAFENWDPDFHECAELFVNGQRIGVRPWSPYSWSGEAAVWKQGSNVVEVKATTSLAGLLDGTYFDDRSHSMKDVRNMR